MQWSGVATRKKKPESPSANEFTVVLEEMRSQFKVFGEALFGFREQMEASFAEVHERFEQVDRRFEQVDRRFEQVDRRFEQVDRRFEQVDRRFEQIDKRFEHIEFDIVLIKSAIMEHGRELRDLHAGGARIEEKLERKVDREEVEDIVAKALLRPHAH
jgi:chromosome segregation ATPase